jgi:hypothetical protein
VSGSFAIRSLTEQRGGAETQHEEDDNTQTWHTVKDTTGSTEDGTATNTLTKGNLVMLHAR